MRTKGFLILRLFASIWQCGSLRGVQGNSFSVQLCSVFLNDYSIAKVEEGTEKIVLQIHKDISFYHLQKRTSRNVS